MILLVAAVVAPGPAVAEAVRALDAGRPEQAREMIRMAVAQGASGPTVDRLLADLAFTERRWDEAVARYDALLAEASDDGSLIERSGIALLHLDRVSEAIFRLDRATRAPHPGWRSWNARGVAADRQQDWVTADRAYAAGLALAPDNGVLRNNRGWSLLLRGRWAEAADWLGQAQALDPDNRRITANADLARAAAEAGLPQRRNGERGSDFAARLNDAGVVALRQHNPAKAIAAFAQALEASDQYYVRAANNLALVEAGRRD
ncbi:hypothetical protein GCM10022281_06490 [Sphingomonas rosea]|uniref:Tetratricopeptide repeat protein n=1 Tax=Sphingomonas rosea TaxID=335605 RepID=A0ABP7TQV6_9SPHN